MKPIRTYGTATGYQGLAAADHPELSTPACPLCGDVMRSRRNRKTQVAFWGCTHYPLCKGTLPDPVDASKANYRLDQRKQGHLSIRPENLRNTV